MEIEEYIASYIEPLGAKYYLEGFCVQVILYHLIKNGETRELSLWPKTTATNKCPRTPMVLLLYNHFFLKPFYRKYCIKAP